MPGFERRELRYSIIPGIPGDRGKLPNRTIELPIEIWFDLKSSAPIWFLFLLFGGALITCAVVTYNDASSDAWSRCTIGRHGEWTYGAICHRRYFAANAALAFMEFVLASILYKYTKKRAELSKVPGPHLQVYRDCILALCARRADPLFRCCGRNGDRYKRKSLWRTLIPHIRHD